MKVIFLGTAGYVPTEDRHTNCILIKDLNLILDAGSGFFRFPKFINPTELHILLSHFHMDHIGGLTQLKGLLRDKKTKVVNIYGHTGIKKAVTGMFSPPYFALPLEKHPFKILLKEVGNSKFSINGAKIISKVFPHSNPRFSVGYRIEYKGKVVTFVTDTIISNKQKDFVRNSDLLIHEAYYPKGYEEPAKREWHSITANVAKLAKETGCKKLALYHFNRRFDPKLFDKEAKEIFSNSLLPEDLTEITV